MGHLVYGTGSNPIEIDDALLAHLRAVTVTKLRRQEAFALTLAKSGDGGRETLWMHAAIPLRFVLDENVSLNRPLLAAMMEAANSSSGLDITNPHFAERLEETRTLHALSA